MNTSLSNYYEVLAMEHRDALYNNEIIPDINWEKPIKGITIQIDLSDEVKDMIESYQRELSVIESELFILPRPFLHLSVNQVIYWNGIYKDGHDKIWDNISEEFIKKFILLDKLIPTFQIIWNRIISLKTATILCGVDKNDEMNNLRALLFSKLPFPKETTHKNSIIHTTIVRYKQSFRNPEKFMHYIDLCRPNICMQPKALILRKENIYPSIDTTEVARIELKN
jgi:hypothetical protein